MGDLSGKVALVTGSARAKGIGRAIAYKLASDGADIVFADLCKDKGPDDEVWKELQDRVAEVESLGRKALACHVNITDDKLINEMLDEVDEKFGRLDIVCNNAGAAFGMNLAFLISPDDWRKMLDINLTGTFLMSRAVVQKMIKYKNGGVIINTSSWRGHTPIHFLGAYSAAKAGVISLTQTMALELAPQNIRVNAICPGKVDTDMERMGWQMKADAFGKDIEDVIKEEKAKIPLGRIAKPEDIAAVVAFLVSDEGSYMTGQAINITGGMTLMTV
ncbi:MAG TPA: SDR family NAD(P)-dependent oxidoreductase [bacterium]|nr:SDR family NAD(P)-dependent oxidoreductase [bacterium]